MRKIREDEEEGNQNAIYVLKYTYIKTVLIKKSVSYNISIYGMNLKVN